MQSWPDMQYNSEGGSVSKRWINAAGWLPAGTTISSVEHSIPGSSGLSFASEGVTGDLMYVTITASSVGNYEVNVKITLSTGEIEYRSINLRVLDRKSV